MRGPKISFEILKGACPSGEMRSLGHHQVVEPWEHTAALSLVWQTNDWVRGRHCRVHGKTGSDNQGFLALSGTGFSRSQAENQRSGFRVWASLLKNSPVESSETHWDLDTGHFTAKSWSYLGTKTATRACPGPPPALFNRLGRYGNREATWYGGPGWHAPCGRRSRAVTSRRGHGGMSPTGPRRDVTARLRLPHGA